MGRGGAAGGAQVTKSPSIASDGRPILRDRTGAIETQSRTNIATLIRTRVGNWSHMARLVNGESLAGNGQSASTRRGAGVIVDCVGGCPAAGAGAGSVKPTG